MLDFILFCPKAQGPGKNRHTDLPKDRQIGTQTGRQAEIQSNRQTNKQIYLQRVTPIHPYEKLLNQSVKQTDR